MSSKRFPGKVLAPFKGRPIIAHLIAETARLLPADRITVATSAEPSDDPLACYVRELGVSVYRGELDHVAARLQSCLRVYPCRWFFRLCADSPLLDGAVMKAMLAYGGREDLDLVTNVFPRTFPKGQSVEMLNARTFAGIDAERLSPDEREHVTQVYYLRPERFKILNLESSDPSLAATSLAVDTVEDLTRLEGLKRPRAVVAKRASREMEGLR